MTERRMIGPTKFEEYSEKYKEFLLMTRRDGIIEVRLHTDGGPYKHNWEAHNYDLYRRR